MMCLFVYVFILGAEREMKTFSEKINIYNMIHIHTSTEED